jgi:hypothetical protein
MNGDIAVRSISASISLCVALSAPRTISSVIGSQTVIPLVSAGVIMSPASFNLSCLLAVRFTSLPQVSYAAMSRSAGSSRATRCASVRE